MLPFMEPSSPPRHTLHNEVADALARGLVTPAEVAGISDTELMALAALGRDALAVGEAGRARVLAKTLIVLAPYWALGWHLLSLVHQRLKDPARAAHAHRAAQLLTPVPPQEHQHCRAQTSSQAASASPEGQLSPRLEHTERSQILDDGRPLPLRDTPAALHHDTVTARITAQALMQHQSLQNTALWAQGLESTHTAIIKRGHRLAGTPSEPHSPAKTDDVTSVIRQQATTRAAARRRMGWPVSDTWSTTDDDSVQPPQHDA